MIRKHLKRLGMPKTWPIKRKELVYITRPFPGKKHEYSLPLVVVLKELIGITKTTRETKILLTKKEVLVDGKKRKDVKDCISFMDVISFPEIDEHYRLVMDQKGKLATIKIDAKEAKLKIVKIINKKKVKGAKMQLGLFDSRNVISKKDDDAKVGDSVIITLPDQKLDSVIALDKGAYVILLSGNYIGKRGVIENVDDKNIIINLDDGRKIETVKAYAFVLGKEKSKIKLTE